jgi:DNA-binding transcriptional regulator LsrR (DeoR family)
VPDGAKRAYRALAALAYKNGVRQTNFACDYGRIAKELGVAKTTAFRYVAIARDHGLLRVLDSGRARAKGQRGRPSRFMLAAAEQSRPE